MRGATEARERLHFVGFVNERAYQNGSFGPAIQFVANPNLFRTAEEAQAALYGWPLGTPDIINARPKKAPEHLQKIADAMSDMTVGEGAKLSEMLKHKWGLRS